MSNDAAEVGIFPTILLRTYAAVLLVIAAAMTLGGVQLAWLGGSFYYVVAGSLLLASAIFLFLRKKIGAWLYGIAFAVTLIWAIYEVGFDGWALLPRLLTLLILGLWLLAPWTYRSLRQRPAWVSRLGGPAPLLVGGALVSVGLGAVLHLLIMSPQRPGDPLFQTGFGAFPNQPGSGAGPITDGADWPHMGGDAGGSHFSALDQIKPENVGRLKVAWSVDVGTSPGITAAPIKNGNTIYTCSNRNTVFAVDAATGEQRWSYDASNGRGGSCRGVSFYRTPERRDLCSERILTATNSAQLIALDAQTGRPCPDFGNGGTVDLLRGMGDAQGKYVAGYYRVTSPPAIIRGKAVVGGWVTDNQYWGEPSGVIRAYDAVTGKFAWAWDMGRPDRTSEPPEGENYTPSTPNSWAPMSADEGLGYVFVPTGNATPDLFGANRRVFDDRFSTSVVAINAETGRLAWSFQTKRHDLWDHDVASQPTLVDLKDSNGKLRKALVQPTKQGEVFVLDRITGKPIFEVTQKRAPQAGAVPEERLSPTQPFSDGLPSFRGPVLREADMWGVSLIDQLYCRIRFRQARYEGPNTPPGLTPSIYHPSTFGAINWGGVAIDPVNRVMVVNSNRMANYVKLIPRAEANSRGLRRQGESPSLRDLLGPVPMEGTPYAADRPYWVTSLGLPCIAPPFGRISAVDLNNGKLLWTDRFGTALGSGPWGLGFPLPIPMGTPNHGGALITRTGLLFIGATPDNFLHAYDMRSGKLLWRTELPGGGNSQPITYTVGGKQYLVITAGGIGIIGARMSTKMVAFTLQ